MSATIRIEDVIGFRETADALVTAIAAIADDPEVSEAIRSELSIARSEAEILRAFLDTLLGQPFRMGGGT